MFLNVPKANKTRKKFDYGDECSLEDSCAYSGSCKKCTPITFQNVRVCSIPQSAAASYSIQPPVVLLEDLPEPRDESCSTSREVKKYGGHCRAIKSESPPINHHRMQSDIRHSIRPPESNVPWDDEVSHSLLSDYTREALETLALPPHQNEFYPNADSAIALIGGTPVGCSKDPTSDVIAIDQEPTDYSSNSSSSKSGCLSLSVVSSFLRDRIGNDVYTARERPSIVTMHQFEYARLTGFASLRSQRRATTGTFGSYYDRSLNQVPNVAGSRYRSQHIFSPVQATNRNRDQNTGNVHEGSFHTVNDPLRRQSSKDSGYPRYSK
ncbi:uncharacterized protein LOC142351775 [Convolutriloba macropyga]|uniref:uncharacterized protein LOC142351775 n=1 Tax=Convolutriloba macropyga TaxID=536237 RepID=UPI003F524388